MKKLPSEIFEGKNAERQFMNRMKNNEPQDEIEARIIAGEKPFDKLNLKDFTTNKLDEFDEEFVVCDGIDSCWLNTNDQNKIKEFIIEILSEQAKIIEEMVVPEIANERNTGKISERLILTYENAEGWNDCRQEVENKFKEYQDK